IVEDGDCYAVTHNKITMLLLKTDTQLLPVRNVTIEELSDYFLKEVLGDHKLIDKLKITALEMRVSSGPEQWGISRWER
ncbi:MAG: 6-pyruvoyl tetrahydropterin synthase, partial [Gammaproteobacteria bacterium]|nr:6-pyruvoyl tetrahydropterin synthase [Gammaproteobacteria bacterium]